MVARGEEENEVPAEVGGIFQGAPASDLDPQIAAKQRQSSLLHC